ncbi:MAG: type III polyketide synthase [Phycisphaerae bacterium]|nr:type III polyketide synthase [Phycisphaerae bacterium]
MTGQPTLASIGCAVPQQAFDQDDLAARLAEAWQLRDLQLERWQRIVRGAGVERRHAVADLATTIGMSTAKRMRVYAEAAPPLALDAARKALDDAHIDASRVTDCIVVSCTGFVAPGVGPILAQRLGLSRRVRHNQVGFMGCFGGILGIRAAIGAASADPRAVVLVLCVELCSLHVRAATDAQSLVAAALFADGAAAVVVLGADAGVGALGELALGHTEIVADSADEMTWCIEDDGFAMTLTRQVPKALEVSIAPFLLRDPPRGIAVHPGGTGILDAVHRGTESLALDPRSITTSREILRNFGNMSSGSVLFVLDAYTRSGGASPVDLVAFGPGLTLDAVRLQRD